VVEVEAVAAPVNPVHRAVVAPDSHR